MLLKLAIWIGVGAAVAGLMEPWAAFLHRKVWHGALWRIHRSHHRRRLGRFEANDVFSVLHAPPAIALILYGCLGPVGVLREVAFAVGLGMTAFGLAYVVVHDGLVHGRLKVAALAQVPSLARIRAAHLVHHRRAGAPYGLFRGPAELGWPPGEVPAEDGVSHGSPPGRAPRPTARPSPPPGAGTPAGRPPGASPR